MKFKGFIIPILNILLGSYLIYCYTFLGQNPSRTFGVLICSIIILCSIGEIINYKNKK